MTDANASNLLVLPDGSTCLVPTETERAESRSLTRQQRSLFDELMQLPSTDRANQRAAEIKDQVARLDRMKHLAHQAANMLWLPNEWAKGNLDP